MCGPQDRLCPKMIRTEGDYVAALNEVRDLMDSAAGTSDGERLEILALLVSDYESKQFPTPELGFAQMTIREFERYRLIAELNGPGNLHEIALSLGVSVATIYNLIRKYGLRGTLATRKKAYVTPDDLNQ